MQITSKEIKWIERLQRNERRWPYVRWLVVVMGLLSTLLCAAFGYMLYIAIQERAPEGPDPMGVFAIVFSWTGVLMQLVFGALIFSLLYKKWNGDVERALLLKLLDEHQLNTSDKPSA